MSGHDSHGDRRRRSGNHRGRRGGARRAGRPAPELGAALLFVAPGKLDAGPRDKQFTSGPSNTLAELGLGYGTVLRLMTDAEVMALLGPKTVPFGEPTAPAPSTPSVGYEFGFCDRPKPSFGSDLPHR
jgi:hypothetical protein